MDKGRRGKSVEEQHAENGGAAADRGVTLLEPYVEDGAVSASRFSAKVRGGFDRLMDDLRDGRFGAQELWLWEASRGSRQMEQWLPLINVCAERGVGIWVGTDERLYRPENAHDRKSLIEQAADAEYESAKTSNRVRRNAGAAARLGRPHGPCPYGYVRRYDPATRALVVQEPHEDEAPVVGELFVRLEGGHSLRSIARDFEARGIVGRNGRPLTEGHLRTLALSGTYAGLRVHEPGRVGRAAVPVTGLTGADVDGRRVVEGIWEGIVTLERFYGVQRLLTDPARRTSRPGKGLHLLSGIATCDVCDGPLYSRFHQGQTGYYCHGAGHVTINEAELDAVAEALILATLASPDLHADLAARARSAPDVQALRDEAAGLRAQLDALADAAGTTMSFDLAGRVEARLVGEVAALERAIATTTTPGPLAAFTSSGLSAGAYWAGAPMTARRAVARLLFSPEWRLGRLSVSRCGAGNRMSAGERVHLTS